MKTVEKEFIQAFTRLDELYGLEDGSNEDLTDEIAHANDKANTAHMTFYRMYRFLEKMAQTYFDNQDKTDRFIEYLNDQCPIDGYLDDDELDDLMSLGESDLGSMIDESDFDSALGTSASDDSDSERDVDNYLNNFYESD